MKIDRKFRKTLTEIPKDCKILIENLKSCTDNDQLFNEIFAIKTWNIGKCELYHWADVLDRFDSILESSCTKLGPDSWQLTCDLPENMKLKKLLLAVLQFTALLIEHSYSRHLYNSIEHLTTLLESTDFFVILSVLNLLYVFSKRSIFITRLSTDKRQALLQRLLYLAESWGGKENGLDLVKCCCYTDLNSFPASTTTVNFEYSISSNQDSSNLINNNDYNNLNKSLQMRTIKLEKVHLMNDNPAVIMEKLLSEHEVPEDKRVLLYTYIRLAHSFPNYEKRKLFVHARLQSLSILVYSNAIQDHVNNLLYDGLIEELVDVLNVKEFGFSFPEIKAASLKTLTAIIHLEKANKLNDIIDTTQASSYHGLLPTLVRKCVDHLIDSTKEPFPHQFATALFSFLYHLATYDTGGDALVKCGIMETLLKVVNHNSNSQEYIMFVTRAVRVIDLITNLDMSSFETHNGLNAFINRLEYEVNECRKEQPFTIPIKKQQSDEMSPLSPPRPGEEEQAQQNEIEMSTILTPEDVAATKSGIACYHQRSALLKSILNFFKKAIADSSNNNVPNLGDSIRHMMDASLPNSLKHIISNAEYYGPSLFLLATDVVQLFIFQEPSQLSQLQDNGLTDVILFALLKKNVPATREVLGSLPTVFSALCLNTRGLNAFIASKPFDKLFQVLLSPDYLPAMRRKGNKDQIGGSTSASGNGTASQLGNAMDELMRHQPSLRIEAMNSIIKLLNQLIEMGKNPSFVCQRQNSNTKPGLSRSSDNRNNENVTATGTTRHRRSSRNMDTGAGAAAQSSEDEDEEYENTMMVDSECTSSNARNLQTTSTNAPISQQQQQMSSLQDSLQQQQQQQSSSQIQQQPSSSISRTVKQYECVPLLDYITNIMKFIEAILSNNSTDDHCKEFVKQKGLAPLLQILTLPNLPIDFPSSGACQSVAQVCKAILSLAREPLVYEQAFECLSEALEKCESLYGDKSSIFEGSLLIRELSMTENPVDSVNCPIQTPLLHSICCIHSFIYLLITLGKTNQNDVKNLTINNWGSPLGVKVLKNLCKLYMSLIWESSMLLWLSNEEQALGSTGGENNKPLEFAASQSFEFNKSDLERLKCFIGSTNLLNPTGTLYDQSTDKMDEGTSATNELIKQATSLVSYHKLLRPLFNCASKLGRSLCELFGNLVKLSAGSPWKTQSRRQQLRPVEVNQPTQYAVNVANVLADICTSGFIVRLPSLEQLHPKFRLTFYICSVGFTSSILFDEIKRPFHLMLQSFEQTGGLKSLFDAFYWALSLLDEKNTATGDKDKLQEGIIEFIESWLVLIQKLVTTKLILESKYSMNQPNPNQNPFALTASLKSQKSSFDPIKFLFKIHKEAFNAIKCLWDKSFIRENQLSEIILNILCQILTGENVLQKKLAEREATTTTTTVSTATSSAAQLISEQLQRRASIRGETLPDFNAPPAVPPPPPPINQAFLSQITSMGFSAEIATEALTKHPDSLEAALEYCCTNPVPTSASAQPVSSTTTTPAVAAVEQSQTTPASSSNNDLWAAAISSTLVEDIDLLNDDNEQIRRAIAMSLGLDEPPQQHQTIITKDDKSTNETSSTKSTSTNTDNDDIRASQLDKQILDEFSANMLPGLFRILDNVPETVYRVCDLIVVVIRRYGDSWRDNCLNYILNEICELIKIICDHYVSLKDQPISSTNSENFIKCADNVDQKLQSRLLLFSLLFEEMQLACSKIVNTLNLLDQLVNMLQLTTTLTLQTKNTTPPWLTSLFILIDLIEKASLATKRKAAMNEQYSGYKRVWKWYEERQNRWMSYPSANNKIIDDAYRNGETTIRIVVSRKHYTISFNSMFQVNEDTSNKRPIMLSFEKPNDTTTTSSNKASNNEQNINIDTLTTPFGNITRHLNPNLKSESTVDDLNASRPSSPLPIEVVRGLNSFQISTVLDCCVDFISYPVSDSDCLHSILRLVLRLTRQHEYAIQFSTRKGPQYILNLTQKSSFVGYASLITLIFRHICEDENNLRLTMEKTIRLALTGNHQNSAGIQPGSMGSREFHNIMRVLGPAICRHSGLFSEVATDILRIVIKREEENLFLNGNSTINNNNNNGYILRTVQAKLMPAISLPEYAHDLVIDLLNCLIKPLPQVEKLNESTQGAQLLATANKQKLSTTSQITDPISTTTIVKTIPPTTTLTQLQQTQPLLLKSVILRILSELVRSYAGCAKIVTTHVYKAGQSEAISEDYNAIAFLLDNFLPSNQTFGDKDCPSLCRLFIVALASCNHCLDSQNALVHEVKLAFNRALNLPESPDKHLKVQSLATIINTMIETCPAIANNPNNNQTNPNIIRQQQQNMVNNMMKIMHKKGLINDLAHAPLYMDLSCSKCIESVNSILKPLETMSKTLNMTARKREMQAGAKTTTTATSSSLNNLPIANVTNATASITAQNTEANRQSLETQAQSSQQQQQQQQQQTFSSNQIVQSAAAVSNVNQDVSAIRSSENETNDEQMIDLNMTEMEPQQALPQDVDMPSVTSSSRRNIDDRVLDRVIEALNQENDSSDSEYEGENRIIRIQTDDNNEQIRIQIETGEDEGEVNSDEEEENSDEDIRQMGYDNEDDGHHHDHDDEESSNSSDSDNSDDDDDDGDGDGEGVDDEDEEDDDENVIDEELVEGSDGRSAVPSDISDDENEHHNHQSDARHSNDPNDPVSAIANAVANALESADAALDRNRGEDEDDDEDDDDEDDHDDDDDEDNEEEEEGEDVNEEGMELDEDDEEIIEDEDEDDEEEEDEEDEEAIDENEEDEHDDASEYYDAYNEMLDYINEDLNENDVREDDILMHLEDLWNQNNHMVLGQAITSNHGRAIQIAVNGHGNDISLPPPPLSVSTVHPLLSQHGNSLLGPQTSSNMGSLQISSASNRLRHQHQQLRSRISRFIIPSLNLQLTTTTPAGLPTSATAIVSAALGGQQSQMGTGIQTITTTTARQSNLPYNALNEILQGTELPMPGASYDMFVSGIYNPQMNSTQDALTYNEAGDHGDNLYIIRNPLSRWNEECTVLDSHSMHHAISLVKPNIIEALEKYKNEELVEKRDKKVKEDEKLKRIKELSDAAAAEFKTSIAANSPPIITGSSAVTASEIASQIINQLEEPSTNITVVEQSQQQVTIEEATSIQQNENLIEQQQTPIETIQAVLTPANVEMSEVTEVPKQGTIEQGTTAPLVQPPPTTTNETAINTNQTADVIAQTTQQASEEIAVSQEAATQFLLNFLSGTCNIFTIINADEKRIAVEALRISDNQRAAQELASINVENYPQNFVFLDSRVLELPSGIDPSFLSALPDNLRREVVLEQLRIQGIDIRNRQPPAAPEAAPATGGTEATAGTSTGGATAAATPTAPVQINPEFLAALPQQIQEELLQQQNLEQQIRAEGRDDDNTAFMRSLPPSLRQAILYDMDQSQISALPDDLATEARTLQQHIQNRERELDLFAATAAHRTSGTSYFGNRYTLGSGNRYFNSASLVNDNYLFASQNYGRLRRGLRHLNETEMNPMLLDKLARGGRQLLDHESLACLLVLLFIDDTRLNTAKLHKVVRNLCIHGPSRAWIIKALLSILEKVSGKPDTNLVSSIEPARKTPLIPVGQGAALKNQSLNTSTNSIDQIKSTGMTTYQPSWLTMSIDGAFGSKTNVFTIYRSNTKKAQAKINDSNTSISINSQACPSIIKQVLEILSTLARAANFNFFPKQPFKVPPTPVSTSAATPNKSASKDPQFWDLVIKLDQSKNKSSKLISQKSTSSQTNLFTGPGGGISQAIPYDDTDVDFNIENSPLARLMIMLENSVLKSNSSLMDKMFTCLAHASAGIPLSENTSTTVDSENKGYENEAVLSKQIQLVVDVLKNKACTQDGLNQAYALLNNLSKINGATRNLIISHLLDGTRELGYAVCQEIDTLLEEALQYKPSEPVNPPTTTQTEDKHIIDSYPTTAGGEGGDEDTSDSLMNSNLPGTSYELMQQSTLQNFIDRYSNLVISSPKAKQVRELQLPSMSKLVEKNSNQKFFVRLIKLIINLRDAIEKEAKKKRQQLMQQQARSAAIAATIATTTQPAAEAQANSETPSNDDQNKGEQKKAEVLNRLSSELDLDSLWNKLSQCLSVLKSLSDPYAVLILQQTVEAFFYVHSTKKDKEETRKKEKETKEAQLAHLDSEYPMSPAAGSSSTTGTTEIANANMEIQSLLNTIGNESPDTKKFLEFALTHRTVLNHILRQTSNNLSDEPYSVLIEFCRLHPSILDFDVKRRYFRQELDKLKDNIRGEDLAVHVKRSNVFDDSYRELNRRTADDWKHRFYIVFEGEEGQDAGGLLREWYLIISKEIFNPDYALFMINPGDRVTYMPNPSSHFNPNHLSYFRFIGRIIAKAIFDNKFLDCYFTRAFYKHILGVPVKYTDMESVDNEFYKNLVSIIESDIDTLGVDLAFSIDINEFGVTQSRDLKPTGHNIRVTNENKSEYIRLVCQEKMIGSIRQQVASFLHGFYEIIPKNLISIFNEQELELLISGLPEIDLEDLKRNTEYHKYTSSSLQIQWFWRALKAFDKEDQAKFLQFVTGTSKVPLQGFAKLEGMNGPQKFQIHRDDRDTSRLPSAHTCFNQLDLPAYENFEKLRNMLLVAIRECSTGFGLA